MIFAQRVAVFFYARRWNCYSQIIEKNNFVVYNINRCFVSHSIFYQALGILIHLRRKLPWKTFSLKAFETSHCSDIAAAEKPHS